MTNRRRFLLLGFLAVALVGLVLLSMSLSGLPLRPGRPFYLGEPQPVTPTPESAAPEGLDFWQLMRIVLPLALWIGIPLFLASIIWAIIRKKKGYLITVLILLGWAALILYLELQIMDAPQQLWGAQYAQEEAPETETPLPTDVFDPAATPEWLVYATSVGLALLLLGSAWSLWQIWRRRPRPLELVAQEAATALEAIRAGTAWQDAVIRCYAEMCQVMTKRGMARRQEVTPREFAAQLEAAGLPGEYIQRLTRLFELVRYGGRQARPQDEEEAVACLSAVIRFCRGEP